MHAFGRSLLAYGISHNRGGFGSRVINHTEQFSTPMAPGRAKPCNGGIAAERATLSRPD